MSKSNTSFQLLASNLVFADFIISIVLSLLPSLDKISSISNYLILTKFQFFYVFGSLYPVIAWYNRNTKHIFY